MKKHIPEKEEYELLPHKEIEELKDELRRLKEFELTPTKKMEISVIDLNKKLDKLIDIFERASHDLRTEEGGLTFKEKMRPVIDKMNRILEQNAEIASGILAVADMLKGEAPEEERMPGLMPPPGMPPRPVGPPRPLPTGAPPIPPPSGLPIPPPRAPPARVATGAPALPPGVRVRTPVPPTEKKRTFGL